jgi:hypothetical protein
MSLESRRRKHAPFRRRGVARRDSSINQAPGDQTMTEGRSKDQDRIGIDDVCIDDQDRALNPIGRFFRHNAMHGGTTRMVLDEFGRCAKCVVLGFWKPDA